MCANPLGSDTGLNAFVPHVELQDAALTAANVERIFD